MSQKEGASPAPGVDVQAWMDRLTAELRGAFGERLLFVGLQGSRGRGESRPDSDIDAVVVLDRLELDDLEAYRALLGRMPRRELACGFLSGREELAGWERSELFQFARDTRPWLGDLSDLLPPVERADVVRAVRIGACGLYHAAVHNLLHDRSLPLLRECCKQAAFVLQAKHFLETGEDLRRARDLLPRLSGEDRAVLESRARAAALSSPEEADFRALSGELIAWAGRVIRLCGDPSIYEQERELR